MLFPPFEGGKTIVDLKEGLNQFQAKFIHPGRLILVHHRNEKRDSKAEMRGNFPDVTGILAGQFGGPHLILQITRAKSPTKDRRPHPFVLNLFEIDIWNLFVICNLLFVILVIKEKLVGVHQREDNVFGALVSTELSFTIVGAARKDF